MMRGAARCSRRGRFVGFACVVGLFLAGCNAETGSSPVSSDAAAEAVQLESQRSCMTSALNSTLYRQQSDTDLENALFDQDLGTCPTDFIEAFVQLRNAARDYLRLSREFLAHQGRKDAAYSSDGLNILCSIMAGAQCVEWQSGRWAQEDTELARKVSAANVTLEAAKANVEIVIARYGLYVRDAQAPAPDPTAADMENGL